MIELIVTMIIIGILAVSVAPRLSGLTGYSEIGFRDRVRATLEYARKSAVAQRRNVRVVVASNSLTVSIASGAPEGAAANTFDRNLTLPGTSSHVLTAPAGVTISPTPTLTFSALGRPSASTTLTISNAGTVSLEAETGYVR